MKPAIVRIGAGSMVFTRTLASDPVLDRATRECELRLVEI
jgi:alpha-galactosidase/6-phospho-beta-glucosidase family protein